MKQQTLAICAVLALSSPISSADDHSEAQTTTPDTGVLEEVTVWSLFRGLDRVTGSAHRINEDALQAFQYDDINRVLNVVPGVYIREEDGYGLRPNIGLRGGDSDRSQKVALMEDGIPIGPAPYSAPAAYFFPLTARIAGVEVYKGASSIQYGPQTVGGAINLSSAAVPDERSVLAEIAAGSDGYRHVHLRAGDTFDDTGVLVEYVHTGSDGFKELDGGSDTGFEKNELLLKLKHEFDAGTLGLRLGYADEVSDETYLGLTTNDFNQSPYRRYSASSLDEFDWDWFGGRIDWVQPFASGELKLVAYAQTFERAWRRFNNFNGIDIRQLLNNPDGPLNRLFISLLQGANSDGVSGSTDDIRIVTNDRTFIQTGLQATGSWQLDGRWQHAIEAGVRYHYDEVERLHDEFAYEQIDARLVQNDQPQAIVTDNTGETQSLALWVRDEISVKDWTIVPGLRVEFIRNNFDNRLANAENDNDYAIVLPGLGARWQATEKLSIIAGIHKGFSPANPSLTDNLDPEESINYELGGRWNSYVGRFELIGFFNDYSNLTAICTFSSGCSDDQLNTQINAGKARTQGLEFGWNHVFALNDSGSMTLPIAITYTHTDTEYREAFFSPRFGRLIQPGEELAYVPADRANASIGLASDRWAVNLSATYVSATRDEPGADSFSDNEGSEEYTVVDLAGHVQLTEVFKITARIDNLFDDEYIVARRPFGARPGKPSTFQIGVSYNY
ncbi:MAG: TonB-dependent receptor [Pseudomonadota bacterium]